MSSDGSGYFQSGGGEIGKPPIVKTGTTFKRRHKRQIDLTGAVTAVGLAAQGTLAVATQALGVIREGVSVGALAANTAIDVARRVVPRRIIVRIYPKG